MRITSAAKILLSKEGPENIKCVCQCLKVGNCPKLVHFVLHDLFFVALRLRAGTGPPGRLDEHPGAAGPAGGLDRQLDGTLCPLGAGAAAKVVGPQRGSW